jgi:hypothetical protein
MSRSHLLIPDPHAHPDYPNDRADYVSRLIIDLQPDVVVMMGDGADMASLSSYDKGKRSFQGKSYKKDIDAHLEFQSRVWDPVKARKKKLPLRVALEGNHEHRIEKALDLSPELEGTIGFKDFEYERYYDEVIKYEGSTPGIIELDGVNYAHYMVSGVLGRPIGGQHPAYSLITKGLTSCTVGHLHLADWSSHTTANGRKMMGLVCGVYQDYDAPWAGKVNQLWWRGVVFKENVEDGRYDPSFISLNTLKKMYG